MTLNRRAFVAGAATVPVLPIKHALATPSARQPQTTELTAKPAQVQIAPPDYPMTNVWAYDGQIPGQTLRYTQGDQIHVRAVNALDQPTTIHWHGLRLPNAMDGVPGMTQPAIAPGDVFDYQFEARDAGTFWYHPHANSLEQVSRGLAGPLVIHEPDLPDVDRDEVIVLDDWRMTETAQLHEPFANRHDLSHAGRLGNYVTANGTPEARYNVEPGQRLRLRLVNTATARIFDLRFQGLAVWVMALDGMPLQTPQIVDQIVLAPAQRVDLFVDILVEAEGDAILASIERSGTFALASFSITGVGQKPRPAPKALPPNDMPNVALAGVRTALLRMEGGAMRGLPDGAVWKGTRMDMRELAMMDQFWAFNAMAGMSDDPLVEAALGETVRVPMTNGTAFPHAMHLHGTHFRTVGADNVMGPWRDTLLVLPGETREIAFVAETPGDWMFHCHMLSHQMAGMMNWIRVLG